MRAALEMRSDGFDVLIAFCVVFCRTSVVCGDGLNRKAFKSTSWVTGLRILLDEMYAGLKEYFETLGWEVLTAQDAGLKGARDKDVVEYARSHDLLLVTQDQKPADLAELVGVKYVLISGAMIARIADQKIREKYLSDERR